MLYNKLRHLNIKYNMKKTKNIQSCDNLIYNTDNIHKQKLYTEYNKNDGTNLGSEKVNISIYPDTNNSSLPYW